MKAVVRFGRLGALILMAVAAAGSAGALAQAPPAGSPTLTPALLRLDDLPPGWSVSDDTEELIGDILSESVCGRDQPSLVPIDAAAALFERGLSIFSTSDTPDDEISGAFIIHAVLGFAPGEATRALACLRDSFEDDFLDDDPDVVYTTLPLPVADLGEERFGLRVESRERGSLSPFSDEVISAIDVALVRRQETLIVLAYFAVDLAGPSPLTTDRQFSPAFARIADQRLALALKGR